MNRYAIVIEHEGSSWGAYVPDLPGCVAAGEIRNEVERLIREAIELHLAEMREQGEEPPAPTTAVDYVDV